MLRRGPPRVRRDLATMQSPSIARVEKKSLRLDDEMQFIRTWMEKPISTGAVMPSSRVLARAMARYVDPNSTGPVIELGPGTALSGFMKRIDKQVQMLNVNDAATLQATVEAIGN